MHMWVYLKSISFLLQASDVLLQGAAGFLLLFQCRPKLLLQSMALSCHLAHLNLDTQRHRHMQLLYNCWFVKLKKVEAEGGGLLPWKFLAADGYPRALLSERLVAQGVNFPASMHKHMIEVEDAMNIFKA